MRYFLCSYRLLCVIVCWCCSFVYVWCACLSLKSAVDVFCCSLCVCVCVLSWGCFLTGCKHRLLYMTQNLRLNVHFALLCTRLLICCTGLLCFRDSYGFILCVLLLFQLLCMFGVCIVVFLCVCTCVLPCVCFLAGCKHVLLFMFQKPSVERLNNIVMLSIAYLFVLLSCARCSYCFIICVCFVVVVPMCMFGLCVIFC